MRSFASPPGLFALGILAWGCAVYDTDMLPSTGGLSGVGASSGSGGVTSNEAGASTEAGSSSTTAGKSPAGGSEAVGEGGAPGMTNGGTDTVPSEAGSDGEAGEGGTSNGGVSPGGSGGAAGKGGSGGTGGTPIACAEHPIPLKTMWIATASDSSLGNGMESDGLYNPPAHMVDGTNERWASGKPQSGDEWIQIDFGAVVNLSQITLNVGNDTGDYPRAYAVRVSNTSLDFNAAVRASGTGMLGNTVVALPSPVTGRYLTVRQTGMNAAGVTKWWAIAEVLVGCVD